MKYKQVKQSRTYKYGEDEEVKTKEEALKKVTTEEQKLKTKMALEGIYKISNVEIIEECEAFKIVVTTNVPILLEEKE